MNDRRVQKLTEKALDCLAVHESKVEVREEWDGELVWEGDVHILTLIDHPTATTAYAFEHLTEPRFDRIVTVLHVPPVDSPEAAVRAAIAATFGAED